MGKDLSLIKYIVMDVDGTLTDGGIYYDNEGNELKKFCVRDPIAFKLAQKAGIELVVLTGRTSNIVQRRMEELNIEYIFQGVQEKGEFLKNFKTMKNISSENICYIGDDLNDYLAMKESGYVACPIDACEEISGIADYVSKKKGGDSAVREIIKHILIERNEWEKMCREIYGFEKNI